MALFDFLKKVQKAVETVSSAAEQIQGFNASRQQPKPAPTQVRTPAYVPPGVPAEDCYCFEGPAEEYFFQTLTASFPHIRIFRNERLAGPTDIPVSFLLYQDGQPKLAIVLCGSQEYRNRRVQNTVNACIARRIPVQRYFWDFRNKADYVVNRVASAL